MDTKRHPVGQKKLSVFLFIIFPFLVSCAHRAPIEYYPHLIVGKIEVLANRTKISAMLEDKHVPNELKKNLRSVLEMREFAIRELGLPATNSFTSYADTGRKFAMWALSATPEFSVNPKIWCFPIGGCSSHLAFFNENTAARYEKRFSRKGYDVSVRGVTAYSNGGYTDDPAMNTFFEWPDYEYASTIFHEMAHEKLHIRNASAFNESFAVFVGQTGQYLWAEKHYGAEFAKRLIVKKQRSVEFNALIARTRHKLKMLYLARHAPEKTRLLKQEVWDAMKAEYVLLKEKWGEYAGYDDWFNQPMNNARIASTHEYGTLVPLFQKLFDLSDGNFELFYKKTAALAMLSPAERSREIQRILANERP